MASVVVWLLLMVVAAWKDKEKKQMRGYQAGFTAASGWASSSR